MTSLVLRADAAPELGVGHLSRCVAVATAARARGWDVALCGTFTAGQWLLKDLPVIETIPPADVVLIDHYGLPELVLPSLTVSIEDGPFGRRRADIVVDANLYETSRPTDGSRLVLRGPAYAPLRAEIRAARKSRTTGSTPLKIVVVMGGGAAPTAIAAAVEAIQETGIKAAVTAISPVEVPGVEVTAPTPELPSLLASADLVVSAAGVTLLELCCIGVPAALVQIADNQKAGYEAAVAQGLAAGLGTDPREHVETLSALLGHEEQRKALADKAMATVDGRGADRILDAIETTLLHERTFRAPGGPPVSTLPEGTDNSGTPGDADRSGVPEGVTGWVPEPASGAVPEGVGGWVPEGVGGAVPEGVGGWVPEGVGGAVPEGVGGAVPEPASGAVQEGISGSAVPGDAGSPDAPDSAPLHERTFRAAGGPPVSTLPESTDNSGVPVSVRLATQADSALLLAWRNDSETRAWSRTNDPVTPAEHGAWLARVLADPNRRLLIAEQGAQPVGTVRFDRDDDHWEVSITVAPEARGRRLAVPILLAAERSLRNATIRACVHRDNAASRALFRRAGYQEQRTDGPWSWLDKTV